MALDEVNTEIAVAAKKNFENLGCVENTRAERDADVRLQMRLVRGPARDDVDAMLITKQRTDVFLVFGLFVFLICPSNGWFRDEYATS